MGNNENKSTNHAKWYEKNGVVERPAYNEYRVATPRALTGVLPNQTTGGIFTLSRMSWGLIDIQESSAFLQATTHMYQEMRKYLGSSMVESLQQVRDYMSFVLEIAVRVKMLERNIAYQFKFSAINPEMPNIFQHVALDPFAVGTSATEEIKSFITYEANPQGNDVAATELYWIKAINDVLAEDFIVPKKFAELAAWMFGSVFIDQYAVNKQYYINDIRRMRLHDVMSKPTDKGITAVRRLVSSNYDPCVSDTPQALYAHISKVKEAYALLIADLDKIKTAEWGSLNMKNYMNYEYKEIHDKEMLSMIDNAYTTSPRPDVPEQDYTFRVDLTEKNSDAETLGICNAVAYMCTLPTSREGLQDYFNDSSYEYLDLHAYAADSFLAPIGQTAIAAITPGANIPAAVNLLSTTSKDYMMTQEGAANGIFALNTSSWVPHLMSVNVQTNAATLEDFDITGDFSNRITLESTTSVDYVILAPMSEDAKFVHPTSIKSSDKVNTNIYVPIVEQPSTGSGLYLRVVIKPGDLVGSVIDTVDLVVKQPFSNNYDVIAGDLEADDYIEASLVYPDTFFSNTPANLEIIWNEAIDSATEQFIQGVLPFIAKKIGAVEYAPTAAKWAVKFTVRGSKVEQGESRVAAYENSSMVLWDYAFANIDHHIPYCTYDAWVINYNDATNSSRYIRTQGQLVLNKPVYKPVFLRTDNVRSTIHYMYVGLFNISVQKPGNKSNNKEKSKGQK